MKLKMIGMMASVACAAATLVQAAELPRASDPASLGFSGDRLQALDARIAKEIEAGSFPGAIVMVARDGQIAHLGVMGKRTEGGEPMAEDAIFRIYSMTKPITSVAAMILVEEGRLDLSHPVHAYLPEYKEMQVATGKDADGNVTLEPARRAMTIQDLLRHTAGLTYGFFGAGPAREAMSEMNLESAGLNNREIARVIGGLPLEHQPGQVWEYSRATDVLGAVIEVVEGRPLGEVFQDRIFDPLGMEDTMFRVADPADQARLAEARADDMNVGPITMHDPAAERAFESGGGGLHSTVHDYARFAQMLLNGGELDGARILSPETVAFMTADHLGDRIGPGKYYLPGPGYGFGLGFGVRLDRGVSPANGVPGEYYWGGAAGTYYFADPTNDMFLVYMMQSPKNRVKVRAILRNMVYGAMTGNGSAD
ncbi:serine hydrolase domain-containing protein [Minwuia thermotolerans]|uniref:Penicillin-binding protein n=1 Tax=Minwuia thermotolerans TaxID=2056226 RepID=A0A2M9FY75_9PROT|nr:serine hydrolase domain-containing protein [Minwuia thermotolerans]PJK28410.1 penicillin-binding protein [Minwuia thermotolerans]